MTTDSTSVASPEPRPSRSAAPSRPARSPGSSRQAARARPASPAGPDLPAVAGNPAKTGNSAEPEGPAGPGTLADVTDPARPEGPSSASRSSRSSRSSRPSPSGAFSRPSSPPRLLLGSTEDVLGAVPYLLGFHPADSLVVIGLTGGPATSRLHLTVRWDLPLTAGGLGRILPLLRKEGVTEVVVVGYGPGPLVTPAADAAMAHFRAGGLTVVDALRVEHGRYWSYACSRSDCCPADGTSYERRAGAVAAEATLQGLVALPDRQTLERSLDPVTGPERVAMREATDRVTRETRDRLTGCRDTDGFAAEFVADGMARVREAIAAYASGGRLDDDQAARLGLDLAVIRIRDEAWALITDDDHDAHLRLWHDLTRRLEPRFLPPVASLLGLVAWRRGDSALAGVALDRACEADPGYSMANLLLHAIRSLVPPHALNDRMPGPEDLDQEMGSARTAWLFPMVVLLDETGGPDTRALAAGVPAQPSARR